MGITLEDEAFAGVAMADQVGSGSERRLERRLLESLGLYGVLCQHGHQSEDERKLAVVAAGEIETHGLFADCFRFGDLGVVSAMVRPSLVAQKLPREDPAFGGDPTRVGETRAGVERAAPVASGRGAVACERTRPVNAQ